MSKVIIESKSLMTVERLTSAEIARSSLAAVRVLERHGIDYCADGSRTLQEVCIASNLSLEVILEELSNADDFDVQDRDWTTEPLENVIRFLVVTDHTYIRSELNVLGLRLDAMLQEHGSEHPLLSHLPKIFSGLREDLELHMKYEERDLFPAIAHYLDAMQSGEVLKGSALAAFGGPLRVMENEHETVGAALRLLRDFAQDYKVPMDSSLRFRALVLGLQALEDRLLRHIYIENNALYPRAAALKPARSPKQSASK